MNNLWITREQAYNVVYQYPGAFAITQMSVSPALTDPWYIITRTGTGENKLYSIHASDDKIEIDSNDIQSVSFFDSLFNQVTGAPGPVDPNHFANASDLSPIP